MCLIGYVILDAPSETGVYAVAEEGLFVDKAEICGLFLYEERVVTAEEAGHFYPGFSNGSAVAAGEVCGEFHRLNDLFKDPVVMVRSPISGIWCDAIDGWENTLTADRLSSLDLPMVMDHYSGCAVRSGSFLRRGDACFKVIDNKKDVLFLADLGSQSTVEDVLTFDFRGQKITGKLLEKKYFGDRLFALVSFAPFDDCYNSRFAEMEWIREKKNGIVVSAAAVTTRLGQEGVYRSDQGELIFCPVSVLDRNEEECLVSGIEAGDRILCLKT